MADHPPTTLHLKIVPGASRSRVMGWLGKELKLTVAAPPESGKANAAVIELLAATLGLPPRDITISAGHTRPRKTVTIATLTADELATRLAAAGFPLPPP